MCFSPEASFTGAAVLSAFGISSINLAKSHKHLLLLACMPFLFAIQQAGEGFVWLGLQGIVSAPVQAFGRDVFLLFAYGIWPIFVPIAMYFAESDPWRKKTMVAIAFMGIAVVATIFSNLTLSEVHPSIVGHSIRYITEPPILYKFAYLVAVIFPFLFSSLQYTRVFAILISIAFFVTDYVYFTDFTSIWCFFGALSSIALYWVIKKAVEAKASSRIPI